jgi:hypothetical protein
MTEVCFECKMELPDPSCPGPTGYGTDRAGNKICYPCCAKHDIEDMVKEGKYTLYLSRVEDGLWYVTNWPGSLKLRVTYLNESHTAGFGNGMSRRDVRFIGPDAKLWYGRNQGNSQLVRCRRMKEKPSKVSKELDKRDKFGPGNI